MWCFDFDYNWYIFFQKLFLWNFFIGRLWLDSENRVYLIKELDRRTGQVFFLSLILCITIWYSIVASNLLPRSLLMHFFGDYFVIEIKL